jgi:RHS repeat-associated protein
LGNWKTTTHTPEGGSSATEVRQHNALNQITKFGTIPVGYEHGNNTGAHASRGNGNILNDGTRVYQYDALNRLIQVSKTPATPVVIAAYLYDALGRRVRKVISNGGLAGDIPNGTTDYIYDAAQCVEERNNSEGFDDTVIRQFVWGRYIDEATQLKTYVTTGGGSLAAGAYYPSQDLLYRTTALTDSTGTIVEAYDTDAYGNTLIFKAAGSGGNWWADDATQTDLPACEYIFTGRQYDPETEIYFYQARYYSPALGRFLSRDPLNSSDDSGATDGESLALSVTNRDMTRVVGEVQCYLFVAANPAVQVDPLGLAAEEVPGPDLGNGLHLIGIRYTLDPQVGHWIPGFGFGYMSRDGFVAVNGPPPKTWHPDPGTLSSCLKACACEAGITPAAALSLIGLGQPTLGKRFWMKNTSEGTSIASKWLSKLLPQRLPFRVWAPTAVRPTAMSPALGRVLGRWVPWIGWTLLTKDAIDFTECMMRCEGYGSNFLPTRT